MIYHTTGPKARRLDDVSLRSAMVEALGKLGPRRRVLLVPPDATRGHARAGVLCATALEVYGDAVAAVLPALGTHGSMSENEKARMFPGVPASLFRDHHFRTDTVTLGEIAADEIRALSGGFADFSFPVAINRLLVEGGFDLILSIGQVVPHEVVGMANQSKNILVGVGGKEAIDRSHLLSALVGIDKILGRTENPVRALFTLAAERFLNPLPIVYALTVVDTASDAPAGLFVGDDMECFRAAAALSSKLNIAKLKKPAAKIVVRLEANDYKSAWLGNKAIYRARLAIADGGEIVILAPGLRRFGEDASHDALIRRHGYRGRDAALAAMRADPQLAADPSAAAHLVHGSTEGRFRVTYCPGGLSRAEIEGAGFGYDELASAEKRYKPESLEPGWNRGSEGEELYYIPNPALGLWTAR